jgi:hypothetical protein
MNVESRYRGTARSPAEGREPADPHYRAVLFTSDARNHLELLTVA